MGQQMDDFSLIPKDRDSAKAVVPQWIDLHKAVVLGEPQKVLSQVFSLLQSCVSSFLPSDVNATASFSISTAWKEELLPSPSLYLPLQPAVCSPLVFRLHIIAGPFQGCLFALERALLLLSISTEPRQLKQSQAIKHLCKALKDFLALNTKEILTSGPLPFVVCVVGCPFKGKGLGNHRTWLLSGPY